MTLDSDRSPDGRLRPAGSDQSGAAVGETVRNETEASQGSKSGRIRWVLVLGIVFVVIAFLAAYLGTRP